MFRVSVLMCNYTQIYLPFSTNYKVNEYVKIVDAGRTHTAVDHSRRANTTLTEHLSITCQESVLWAALCTLWHTLDCFRVNW